MQGELKILQRCKNGIFDEHTVRGTEYEDTSGETGWLIASEKENKHTYCWVSGEKEFLIVNISDWPNLEDKREIKTYGVKTDIGTAERSAILAAIHYWRS